MRRCLLYDAVMAAAAVAVQLMSPIGRRGKARPKILRWADGRCGLLERVEHEMDAANGSSPFTVWLHAASQGEYAIARALARELRARHGEQMRIVLTFFSPSGYENVKSNPDIDHIFYLPLDTRANAARWLDAIQPDMAAFMVSEYWYNFLSELSRRNIPTYLISAKVSEQSALAKPWGFLQRRCIKSFRGIFAADKPTADFLRRIGCSNVQTMGDPLIDNALARSRESWSDPAIAQFTAGARRVLVAGSAHHDDADAMLVNAVARHIASKPDERLIVVPHHTTPSTIEAIQKAIGSPSVLYSQLSQGSPARPGCNILIVDANGLLAYLYRVGTAAYIGGGFTPLLHSIVEATVYGLPTAFGPRIERKATAQQLVAEGLGTVVSTPAELVDWWQQISGATETQLDSIRRKADSYININIGATALIVNHIAP